MRIRITSIGMLLLLWSMPAWAFPAGLPRFEQPIWFWGQIGQILADYKTERAKPVTGQTLAAYDALWKRVAALRADGKTLGEGTILDGLAGLLQGAVGEVATIQGSPAATVKAILGPPASIRETVTKTTRSATWTYAQVTLTVTGGLVVGMSRAVDPLSGDTAIPLTILAAKSGRPMDPMEDEDEER